MAMLTTEVLNDRIALYAFIMHQHKEDAELKRYMFHVLDAMDTGDSLGDAITRVRKEAATGMDEALQGFRALRGIGDARQHEGLRAKLTSDYALYARAFTAMCELEHAEITRTGLAL